MTAATWHLRPRSPPSGSITTIAWIHTPLATRTLASSACISWFLALSRLTAPTTDWLSTSMGTCARRNTSGCRVQI